MFSPNNIRFRREPVLVALNQSLSMCEKIEIYQYITRAMFYQASFRVFGILLAEAVRMAIKRRVPVCMPGLPAVRSIPENGCRLRQVFPVP